ncbi:MAG: hypothetical protein CLLPBCKN_000936 [Chroococcidiopsis cubana SAG 39.79]|uniref:hypothetical protein n=1 Tax=Chroococcidiopsis cubana TaxID=171392 RepID=UPI002AC6AED8|nr:hypothetical protein [Chroococcidiopsis cubana]MDZ4871548.1 hypothetical protein [Chroococcidiopsis cubana SAG 39.79]
MKLLKPIEPIATLFVADLLLVGILPATASYGRWDASYNGYGDTNYTAVPSDYDGDKKQTSVFGVRMELGILTTPATVMVVGMPPTTAMVILTTLPFLPTMMAMLKLT